MRWSGRRLRQIAVFALPFLGGLSWIPISWWIWKSMEERR
jgi:hypothetical protein